VFGSALASEGIFAFFLESGFLAILVFGWDRVGPKMHFFSTLMVFLGSVFSSVWIVIANSWMHTPAGYHLVERDGHLRAEITDFWAMIFNPSSMHRLGHVLLGAFILGAFFTMSIGAYYLLKRRHEDIAKRAVAVGLIFGALSSVGILVSGHSQARAMARNQPAKLAAVEGHFHTGEGPTDLYVVGWPDREAEVVHFGIALPGMLSFLAHDDFETPIPGLDQIDDEDEPPVLIPFLTYHVMVGCGMYFIALTLLGCVLLWRRKLWDSKWLLRLLVISVPLPYLANQAGWVATEVGRQPWVVYGELRTADAVSAAVGTDQVSGSIVLFGLIYIALVVLWLVVMNEKIQHGPEDPATLGPKSEGSIVEAATRLSLRDTHRMTHPDEEE